MARARKENVEYFPHDCVTGKTVFILESLYGNDGYATWFKMLQQLGHAKGHFIDLRDRGELMHVAAYCRVTEEMLIQILDTLAGLDAIDPELWRQRVVFSVGLVRRVTDAWRLRINNLPSKEKVILALNLQNPANPPRIEPTNGISSEEMQERERERERERKEKTTAVAAPAAGTKTELAFFSVFAEKETRIRELYPQHNYEAEMETCIAHYRNDGSAALDPYKLILKWFNRAQVGAIDFGSKRRMSLEEETEAMLRELNGSAT